VHILFTFKYDALTELANTIFYVKTIFYFCSKPEYVIFKLKEMGIIEEKDIEQVCKQFDDLDSYHRGKITVADLIEGHANKAASRPER